MSDHENRGYKKKAALFLASQGTTLFGSSVVQFAIVWYVPQFVISFFSGVWADRFPRKKLIVIADAVIAAATLALALMMPYIGSGTPLLIALLVISVVRSLGAGVQTPAVGAAIPQLVPEDLLMKYNGLNATIQSLVQFAAPAAAGALLSVATLREALFTDIVTAAVGIGLLCAVSLPFTKAESTPSMVSEMKEGFRYAVRERFVGKLLIVFGVFIFLCVPAGFLASLFVSRFYGDTYWYMTLVEVIGFIGMTAGGVLIGAWGGFANRVKTFAVGMIAFGVLAICMGAVRNFIVYLVMMAVYGVALTMVQTAATTLLQENSAPEMQGRMFGLFGAMYSGFLPLGMAVFGPLADVISLRLLMIISGVMLLLLASVILCDVKFFRRGKGDGVPDNPEKPQNTGGQA